MVHLASLGEDGSLTLAGVSLDQRSITGEFGHAGWTSNRRSPRAERARHPRARRARAL